MKTPPSCPRPTVFTPEIGEAILAALTAGTNLTALCAMQSMPGMTTLSGWLADPVQAGFRRRYAQARQTQAEAMLGQIASLGQDHGLAALPKLGLKKPAATDASGHGAVPVIAALPGDPIEAARQYQKIIHGL